MAYTVTVTVTDSALATAIPDAKVWICSDAAGTVLLFEDYTSTAGVATFSLDNGTYYAFWQKAGYSPDDSPETVTVASAALAVAIEMTAIALAAGIETEVANGALDLLGSGVDTSHLSDYATDTGDTADACRRNLPKCRKLLLESFPFIEAIKYLLASDSGADDSSVVHPDWLYAYALPSDCLRLLALTANNNPNESNRHILLEYERYQNYILTDYTTSEFYWWYIADVEDLTLFPQATRDALEYLLAAKLVGTVLKGPSAHQLRTNLLREYELYARRNAVRFNQRQQFDPQPHGATSIVDIT